MSDQKKGHSRRDFLLKTITLAPAVAVGSSALGAFSAPAQAQAATPAESQVARDYQPSWFTAEEFVFINAAVARLIPADERGPGALEAGVPEFIDRQMNTPYATGANWYMQGPFNPDLPKKWAISCRWYCSRFTVSAWPTPTSIAGSSTVRSLPN